MKTWLYLTAEGLAAPSLDWPCCVWSSTGQRQLQPLNQAAQALQEQAVDLLLPMELCSWVRSEPWPARRRPAAQAIAFAVEEQLGEPLEKLHLSVGARDPQGSYPVMVIDRERFAAVLQLLKEAGIEVRSVFVDADRLPQDQALGVWWFGRWMLGGGLPARLTLTEDGLTLLKPGLPIDIEWHDERQEMGDADQWLTLASPQAINLLHGDFARQRKRLPWRLGGLAMALLLALNWGPVKRESTFSKARAVNFTVVTNSSSRRFIRSRHASSTWRPSSAPCKTRVRRQRSAVSPAWSNWSNTSLAPVRSTSSASSFARATAGKSS